MNAKARGASAKVFGERYFPSTQKRPRASLAAALHIFWNSNLTSTTDNYFCSLGRVAWS
jgi:hypothetical protein